MDNQPGLWSPATLIWGTWNDIPRVIIIKVRSQLPSITYLPCKNICWRWWWGQDLTHTHFKQLKVWFSLPVSQRKYNVARHGSHTSRKEEAGPSEMVAGQDLLFTDRYPRCPFFKEIQPRISKKFALYFYSIPTFLESDRSRARHSFIHSLLYNLTTNNRGREEGNSKKNLTLPGLGDGVLVQYITYYFVIRMGFGTGLVSDRVFLKRRFWNGFLWWDDLFKKIKIIRTYP